MNTITRPATRIELEATDLSAPSTTQNISSHQHFRISSTITLNLHLATQTSPQSVNVNSSYIRASPQYLTISDPLLIKTLNMPTSSLVKHTTCARPLPSKQAPPVSQKAFDLVCAELRYEKWLKIQQDKIIRARLVVLFAAVLAVKMKLVEKSEEDEESEDSEDGEDDQDGAEESESD